MSEETAEKPENSLEKPLKTVWLLAWPAVTLNALQTLNALLDSAFVDKVGGAALTAIGASTTTLFLFVSMSMAVGVAATAMVSRYFGAGEKDRYIEANLKCLGFAMVSGFILMLIAYPFAPLAVRFFLPPDATESAKLAVQYLKIVFFFLPPIFIIQTLAGSLRGIGDTKSPMVISGIQILLHIALNYFLIFPSRTVDFLGSTITLPGFGMGVQGAATALVISAWMSAIVYLLWIPKTPLGSMLKVKIPDLGWVKRIFSLAAPAGMMSIVRVTSLMMFQVVLKSVPKGEIAIGSLRPGFSIEALAFMPSFGLAIAASALVGQSLGMKKPERASSLGWMAAHQAGIVSTIVAICLFIFAKPIASFVLGEQQQYANMVASYLRHVSVTETLFGYGMVLIAAQQGAGDTKRPLWLTLFTMYGCRVPLAAILALESITLFGQQYNIGLGLGANGCWLALSITAGIQGILAMILWYRGAWKTAKV